MGLMVRYLLLIDSYGLVFLGRPLWREDVSVFCTCCWPSPSQSFLGPSPLGFYSAMETEENFEDIQAEYLVFNPSFEMNIMIIYFH
jgi:hypothetical protein